MYKVVTQNPYPNAPVKHLTFKPEGNETPQQLLHRAEDIIVERYGDAIWHKWLIDGLKVVGKNSRTGR